MKSAHRRLLLIALLGMAAASIYTALAPAAGSQPKTQLISRESASDGGAGANEQAFDNSISGDGNRVVFGTIASNLSTIEEPGVASIYVYDRSTKTTTLVSRQGGPGGVGADDHSNDGELSSNGRFVAFNSDATNLGFPTAPFTSNIYVFDLKNETLELISRKSNGDPANDSSYDPEISGNGRYVMFNTAADNLGGPIKSSVEYHQYVHDRKTDKTTLISRKSGGGGAGANGDSDSGGIDGSGRRYVFESNATNLGAKGGNNHVYIYDMKTKKTSLVSRRSGAKGKPAKGDSGDGEISKDGKSVVFETEARNLGGKLKHSGGDEAAYLRDLTKNKTYLVSRKSGKKGVGANGDSDDPDVSGNGRYIVFETDGKNLGNGVDPSSSENIYRYDRKLKKVELISRASGKKGAACEIDCDTPYISDSGKITVFRADGGLFGGPTDANADNGHIYVRKRP